MNSDQLFNWEQVKQIAEKVIYRHFGEYLRDVEITVLQGSWQGLTYEEIARTHFHGENYLRGDIGPKLWRKLSDALGEEVTKRNFKSALERASLTSQYSPLDRDPPPVPSLSSTSLPFPDGSVALDSPLYVEREDVESFCYETIAKPGSLIRIKAPKLMGKTSLLTRIVNRGQALDYRGVSVNLKSVERGIVKNLDKFLRWLCFVVGRELGLENRLKERWDTEILGSNDNCTVYFEEYLLPGIDRPLVFGLDDVDAVFPHAEVVEDFLGMLRSWHEKGKTSRYWKQVRLVMAHSTECYIPLDMNQSPFNAGIPVELPEFDRDHVLTLGRLYGLPWGGTEERQLMNMVGGHPYLIRLAMYEIGSGNMTLEQLLREAATESGIYSDHLRRHLETFQQNPELARSLQKVVTASEPVELDSMQIYKLHSMGLVHRRDNLVVPRCTLYRQYFQRVLSNGSD